MAVEDRFINLEAETSLKSEMMAQAELEYMEKYRAIRSARRRFILRAYTLLGFLTSFVGVFYFALSVLDFTLSKAQTLALIAAGAGAMTGFMSIFVLAFERQREELRRRESRSFMENYDLVQTWNTFELSSREALESRGIYLRTYSPRIALIELRDADLINDREFKVLHAALDMRNSIVHGTKTFSREEILKAWNEVFSVSLKLLRARLDLLDAKAAKAPA